MTRFDALIQELAIHVRDRLKVLEDLSSLDFEIEVSGRVHDGDLRINYQIGSTYNEGGVVKGPRLEVVIDEYLRRFGWDMRNQPLCISFDGTTQEPESI